MNLYNIKIFFSIALTIVFAATSSESFAQSSYVQTKNTGSPRQYLGSNFSKGGNGINNNEPSTVNDFSRHCIHKVYTQSWTVFNDTVEHAKETSQSYFVEKLPEDVMVRLNCWLM